MKCDTCNAETKHVGAGYWCPECGTASFYGGVEAKKRTAHVPAIVAKAAERASGDPAVRDLLLHEFGTTDPDLLREAIAERRASAQQREAKLREALKRAECANAGGCPACGGGNYTVPGPGKVCHRHGCYLAVALAASEPPQAAPEAAETVEEELSGLVFAWRDDASSARQRTPGELTEVEVAEAYDECADEIEALLARRKDGN